MSFIELSLYEVTKFFLTPVLLLIIGMFLYAFFALGVFLVELLQRLRADSSGKAYPSSLDNYRQQVKDCNFEALEIFILKKLEPFRIVSRAAPMLGLVATMIPMGPALLSLSEGDSHTVSENLVVAFSAVITALLAASITFVILTLRRRWLLTELHALNNEL
ncbi:MAG: MotA/TolQ/ExbB proton channel family protein [Gammaproteobacteria bacterium]|nr:MotA/TolQ/ExbB proton channel family protein [Gammaproteobacteria bacterium]